MIPKTKAWRSAAYLKFVKSLPCAVAIVIARHMGERYGVTCPPWPTRFRSE